MEKKRKGNLTCCVRACKNVFHNTGPEIKFYAFPTAKYKVEQCELWKRWVRKTNSTPDWEPKRTTRICSVHFAGNRTSPMPRSPCYAPTIVTRKILEMQIEEISAIERFERSVKRTLLAKFNKDNVNADSECPPIKPEPSELLAEPRSQDKSIQVEVFDVSEQHQKLFNGIATFVCSQYIRNDVCDAQTQAYIPQKPVIFEFSKKRTKNKCCGTSIVQVDKAIGPDEPEPKKRRTSFPHICSMRNDQELLDLCGVTLSTFALLLKALPDNQAKKISKEDRLFIFLTKMRTGMSFSAMSVLYRVHRTTVSRIFVAVLKSLRVACEGYVPWPRKQAVRDSMPEDFKKSYGDCRVIITTMEIKLEPGTVDDRLLADVHRKQQGATTKFLVGFTPSGLISFVSTSFVGRTSDSRIVEDSGILDLLETGDVVVASKDLPAVRRILKESGKGALEVVPPFSLDRELSTQETNAMYRSARVRVHNERSMQRLKFYKILNKFSVDTLPHAHSIVFVCCALANLQPPRPPSQCRATQCRESIDNDDARDAKFAI